MIPPRYTSIEAARSAALLRAQQRERPYYVFRLSDSYAVSADSFTAGGATLVETVRVGPIACPECEGTGATDTDVDGCTRLVPCDGCGGDGAARCQARECDRIATGTTDDGCAFCAKCLRVAERYRDEETAEGHRAWLHGGCR